MTLGNKKSSEESLLDELRHRMKDDMPQELYEDDHMFLRFIRARNYNIDAAEAMLRNHMKFRKQHKTDSLLTDFTPHELMTSEYFPITKLGTDLDGAPVTYIKFGSFDTKGMLKIVKPIDILMYCMQYLERDLAEMKETTKQTGKLVDGGVYIFDCENISLTTATHKQTIETILLLLTSYEANYPETLKTAYVINASYYFTLLWTVAKPFISGPTQKKIKLFGKTGWRDELLERISPDVLPAFLGGDRTDPDGNPLCKTLVRQGGPIPESLFPFSGRSFPERLPGAARVQVSRLSRAQVRVQVPRAGSTLEWEFAVRQRDVGFAVLRGEDEGGQRREVIPRRRVETVEAPEAGIYRCEEAGVYYIEFDNSYSWIHRKEIYYKVSVEMPRKLTII